MRTRRALHSAPAPESGLGRRAFLTAGGLTAAGTAGAIALGATAASATGITPDSIVYGPAPSGGDDTAALQAALPVQGVMYLQAGTYQLTAPLVVGNGQDICGTGGGCGKSSTTLLCTTATAGLTLSGSGGISQGLRVDGNNVAVTPFLRNGGTGNWVGRTMQDITVTNSVQDGITALSSQNDAWYKVVSMSHARDSWVLDGGYGGGLFSRCEFADAGRYNLRIDSQQTDGPYLTPSNLNFHQCIVEYSRSTTSSLVYINGTARVKFDHTSFYASVAPVGPLIYITGKAVGVVFEDALIQNTASGQTGMGLLLDTGCQVILSGVTHFQNLQTPLYFTSRSSIIDVKGMVEYASCSRRYAATAGIDPQSCISNSQSEILVSTRRSASDLAYVSANLAGTPGYFAFENAAGRKVWGSGSDFVGDVALSRRTAGVLGVDSGQLFATGYGPIATRQAPNTAAVGALRYNTDSKQLEVSDGGIWRAPTFRSQTFMASGTFSVPAGVTMVRIRAMGAGGGGGGGGNIGLLTLSGSAYGGAGGGAGMSLDLDLAVTSGDVLTLAVGTGGAGGAGATSSSGVNGNAGQNGAAGGTTAVTNAAGKLLLTAAGGGGGAGAPGATLTGSQPPTGPGAFGCPDLSPSNAAPGCGSMAGWNAIPTVNGLCGGASGAPSTSNRGGGSGSAPLLMGQRAVAGAATNMTPDGSNGAVSQLVGGGGNGGGAGGSGGIGGNGGNGTNGAISIMWVS